MDKLRWKPVNRKRSNKLKYNDPEYNRGYDLDMEDFTSLVVKYNANSLNYIEECRLGDHVMTMMNIVLENPKINPRSPEELDKITDDMFMSGWNSLHYIKDGKKPYSYVYRCMYTAACKYYTKVVKDRKKQEEIDEWVTEAYLEYRDSVRSGKVGEDEVDEMVTDAYIDYKESVRQDPDGE